MIWQNHEWHEFALLSITVFFGRYALIPGLFYLILWKNPKKRWQHKKIQPDYPDNKHIRGEIAWSILSLCIFVLVSMLLYYMYYQGYTKIYLNVSDYGWTYFVFSIGLMILIHDCYFYWSHRLMHTDFLYRFHKIHHHYTNPSPWSSFSFHPIEAFIEVGIAILIVVIMPAHPLAVSLFLLYMTSLNVMGHSGFELFPPNYTNHWFWKLHNTSTHHNMHHLHGRYNYGIYFNFWDKLMKTNHPDYIATFKQVSSRTRP